MNLQVIFHDSFLHLNSHLRRRLTIMVCGAYLFCGFALTDLRAELDSAPLAELVWFERTDDKWLLKFSSSDGESWSDPKRLYESKESLTTPGLGTDQHGNKLLIWTEQRRNKTILKFMRRPRGQEWQDAELFSDAGRENYGPTIVYDQSNTAWVFWASTRKDLSDIYVSQMTSAGWTKPSLVHAENDVPDIGPVASLTDEGNVKVVWTHFSLAQGGYIQKDVEFEVDSAVEKKMVDLITEEELILPGFLPNNALSIIHFPSNMMVQSRPIAQTY